jgi:hypothetical protein
MCYVYVHNKYLHTYKHTLVNLIVILRVTLILREQNENTSVIYSITHGTSVWLEGFDEYIFPWEFSFITQ